MADKWQALYNFWASFGFPAYEENSVPDLDEVSFPYITYEAASSGWDDNAVLSGNIWTRSSSWADADSLADLIHSRLKDGGYIAPYSGGMLWITPGSPFSQSMGDPDDDKVKRKLLTVTVNFS